MSEDIVAGITAPEDDGQTPLYPDETSGLLLDWVATRGDLNVAEEENIASGIAWGQRVIGRQPVLSQDFLRALHSRMFGRVWAWAGRYRDTERNIGVAPHAIAADIQNLVDDAIALDEDGTYELDERAVRLHHRLTAIHPFPNGNGRCARVFTDLYLDRSGAAQFTWGAGLAPQVQRTVYITALRSADARNYAPLLAFVRR